MPHDLLAQPPGTELPADPAAVLEDLGLAVAASCEALEALVGTAG